MTDDSTNTNIFRYGPIGLGGWLILPILHLISTTLLTLYSMVGTEDARNSYGAIIEGATPQIAAMRVPLFASTMAGLIVVVLAVVAFTAMLRRASITPKLMVTFYVTYVLGQIIDYLWIQSIDATLSNTQPSDTGVSVLQAVVLAAVWITYFLRSKRVANTFGTGKNEFESEVVKTFS